MIINLLQRVVIMVEGYLSQNLSIVQSAVTDINANYYDYHCYYNRELINLMI